MKKSATLNLRVNPQLKTEVEEILSRLGIPISTAVDIYLNQIVLVGGIPFSINIPKPPSNVDITQMTEAQLHAKLARGYDDYKKGKTRNAEDAFSNFEETHGE